MFNTAMIDWYRYSAMRPGRIWVYISIYVLSFGMLMLINWMFFQFQRNAHNLDEFFKPLYFQTLLIEVLILWMWSAYNSATAIREEMFNKSYDFFRLFPLSSHEKAVGILIGRNLAPFMLGGATLLALALFGFLGRVSIVFQAQMLSMLLFGVIFVNAASLLSSLSSGMSTVARRNTNPIALAVVVVFFYVSMLPMLFAASDAANISTIAGIRIGFFALEVPLLILLSCVTLYFSAWCYAGIVRKLSSLDLPLFSLTGTLLFVLGFNLIVAGLFVDIPKIAGVGGAFWMITYLPLLIIPFASLNSYDRYLEHIGQIQQKVQSVPALWLSMIRFSSLFSSISMFAIWALFALGAAYIFEMQFVRHFYIATILFSFHLFYASLLELSVLYKPRIPKIGLLLGFIAIISMSLPLLIGGILDFEQLRLHSPVGFISVLFDEVGKTRAMSMHYVLAVNLACVRFPSL